MHQQEFAPPVLIDSQCPEPVLDHADRLQALAQSGLTEQSDPGMEFYARRVQERLGVPVALTSIVQADRQVFPGMVGLTGPWANLRYTPLTHSFCQYVVASAEPLVVDDALDHPWVRDNLAVSELGVAAYAGMPLTDDAGWVLGSLAAIDTAPRVWSEAELATLADLAHGCSMELRLRLSRFDAARERRRRDEADAETRAALSQSQTLLSASQWLTQVSTVTDIRVRVGELITTELAPTYISMVLLGPDGMLHRMSGPDGSTGPEDRGRWGKFSMDAPMPSATAVRERRIVQYTDRAALVADHPDSTNLMRALDLEAVVVAPLMAGKEPLGSLILGWDRPRVMNSPDLIAASSIAGYAAQALVRVRLLHHRISVAHELQQAMLGALPPVEGLVVDAQYLPADAREEVGGDWYDLTALPATGRPGARGVAVTVGDIVGHDLHAASIMGQVRSMLRQACWSSGCASPAAVIADLEDACLGVGLPAAGTALLARLEPCADATGRWTMTWTNAGQSPPVLLRPDGRTQLLDDHDIMLGYRHLTGATRNDHRILLEPGDTLLLYTDGLVETHHRSIDDGIAELLELLETLRGRTPSEIVDDVIKTLVTTGHDDTVALAITIQHPISRRD